MAPPVILPVGKVVMVFIDSDQWGSLPSLTWSQFLKRNLRRADMGREINAPLE